MPREITAIKDFLATTRRADARQVTIKKEKKITKLKIRTSKYLFTLVVKDAAKAKKLVESLPPGLKKVEL